MRSVDIRDEMRKQGIEIDDALEIDGQIHRFDVPGDKRGRRNGWYVFHQDGDKVYGAFGDWKTGIRGTLGGSAARKVMAQVLRDSRADDEAKHARAALRAQMEWGSAWDTAAVTNPYLLRKMVRAFGVRGFNDVLLVPMRRGGALVGLQKIYPDGRKRFTPGCKKLGAAHMIDGVSSAALVIAEGYATGASVRLATGLSVLVAFDAGNLLPAAKQFVSEQAKGVKRALIWAADNDEKTPGNPGVTKATAAAKELGGRVVVPNIAGDFNDLHIAEGLGAVATIVYDAL